MLKYEVHYNENFSLVNDSSCSCQSKGFKPHQNRSKKKKNLQKSLCNFLLHLNLLVYNQNFNVRFFLHLF